MDWYRYADNSTESCNQQTLLTQFPIGTTIPCALLIEAAHVHTFQYCNAASRAECEQLSIAVNSFTSFKCWLNCASGIHTRTLTGFAVRR